MKFVATTYLKEFSLNVLFQIIIWWEEWRMGQSEESVYDLKNKEDFTFFIEKYGIENTINYYNECQYWMDGNAFTEPLKMDVMKMIQVINSEFNIEFFKEVLDMDMDVESDLFQWFNMPAIVNTINKNVSYELNCSFKSDKDIEQVNSIIRDFMVSNFSDCKIHLAQ